MKKAFMLTSQNIRGLVGLLDLRKTSSSSGISRGDAESLLCAGRVSKDTMTAEKEILRSSGMSGLAGILRKSSLIVIALLLVLAIQNRAQAAPNTGPIGLQISPVIVEVNVDPGQTYTFKVSPFNITDNDLELTPLVNDFKSRDETGTPQIVLDGSLPASASLKNWLTLSDSSPFQLAPKTTKPVIVTLNVPKNAEPGGHYGVVRFTGAGVGQNQDNVALVASWGTLVLVRVSGNITERLNVVDFYTSRHGARSGWFEKEPISFTERINNGGNVHVKPKGNITITNMFGKQTGSIEINGAGGNVLPSSIRRFDQTFNKANLFGRYTATFNLAYGTNGQILSSSLSFWVIPYKLIIIVLVVLALVIWLGIMGIKRYNRSIVKRALRR